MGGARVEALRRLLLLVVRLHLRGAVLLLATLMLPTLLAAALVLLTGLLASLTRLTGLLIVLLVLVELDRLAGFGLVPTTAHVTLITILTHVTVLQCS